MSTIVCIKDQWIMVAHKNGAIAIEYRDAAFTTPDKIWRVDVKKCPKCDVKIITGFAVAPLKYDFSEGFAEEVAMYLENPETLKFY